MSSTRSSTPPRATTRRSSPPTPTRRRSPTSTPTPGPNGTSATITWDTDEPSDSRVDYGTDPDALTQSQSDGVAGQLAQRAADRARPEPDRTTTASPPRTRTTTRPRSRLRPRSRSASRRPRRASSTPRSPTSAPGRPVPTPTSPQTGNGEVTLKPTVGEEFSGGPGAARGVAGPAVEPPGRQLQRRRREASSSTGPARALRQTYGSGRSLEFAANFGGANFQHVGFGVDYNQSPNWAMFSIRGDGSFSARTNAGGTTRETVLPNTFVGSQHRYRIEWDATEVRYFIDGNLVATHDEGFDFGATQMRPLASDLNSGGPERVGRLAADEPVPGARASSTRASSTPASRSTGGRSAWTADTPTGTGVALSVRTGNTPTPDGSWSAFTPIARRAATTSPAARATSSTAPSRARATRRRRRR